MFLFLFLKDLTALPAGVTEWWNSHFSEDAEDYDNGVIYGAAPPAGVNCLKRKPEPVVSARSGPQPPATLCDPCRGRTVRGLMILLDGKTVDSLPATGGCTIRAG